MVTGWRRSRLSKHCTTRPWEVDVVRALPRGMGERPCGRRRPVWRTSRRRQYASSSRFAALGRGWDDRRSARQVQACSHPRPRVPSVWDLDHIVLGRTRRDTFVAIATRSRPDPVDKMSRTKNDMPFIATAAVQLELSLHRRRNHFQIRLSP